MKTCLFGGSFDPVHAGHLAIAAAAQEQAGLQRVVFLPANRSPFKQEGAGLFPAEVRLRLLRAA
ncbi:MAG: adenylyltransferase/cytidyltransferase family protein, partial [Akkermansia muciniphila]|nr:adenylyltransferase/cytidyltransferase family protein [Akkermansia muciniphila]